MLRVAFAFLILSLLAAFLGYSQLAGTSSSIAWILFVVFIVLFVVSLVAGRGRQAGV